jgi:uncharacterized membrane protein
LTAQLNTATLAFTLALPIILVRLILVWLNNGDKGLQINMNAFKTSQLNRCEVFFAQ